MQLRRKIHWNPETEQIVGLKILDKKKTEQLEARFKGLDKPTEGEIAVQFRHPRIVVTHSHGITTNDEQFLVMEFLDGPGLNSLLIAKSPLLAGNRLTLTAVREPCAGRRTILTKPFTRVR